MYTSLYLLVCHILSSADYDCRCMLYLVLEKLSKDLGAKVTVKQFVRYEMGEGPQKRENNFAEEVMCQTKA